MLDFGPGRLCFGPFLLCTTRLALLCSCSCSGLVLLIFVVALSFFFVYWSTQVAGNRHPNLPLPSPRALSTAVQPTTTTTAVNGKSNSGATVNGTYTSPSSSPLSSPTGGIPADSSWMPEDDFSLVALTPDGLWQSVCAEVFLRFRHRLVIWGAPSNAVSSSGGGGGGPKHCSDRRKEGGVGCRHCPVSLSCLSRFRVYF